MTVVKSAPGANVDTKAGRPFLHHLVRRLPFVFARQDFRDERVHSAQTSKYLPGALAKARLALTWLGQWHGTTRRASLSRLDDT